MMYDRLTPRLYNRDEFHVEAVMGTSPEGNYVSIDVVTALESKIKELQVKLAIVSESELDLHSKVIQLESEAQGPDGVKTWQEAAVTERLARSKVQNELRKLQQEYDARDEEACELIERWLDAGQPHDWTGWQKRVEVFLGINIPESIPPHIHYVLEHDNFYDDYNKGQGQEFYSKWHSRKDEFPTHKINCIGTWP